MRVACVQLEACDLERAEEGLSHALSMTENALELRPDVVVLPECTYPAYFLAGYDRVRLRPPGEVLEMFARLARRGQCYLAVGLVEPGPAGRLLNSAVLLSPAGEVVARGHKHFLWHFDRRWFDPGPAPAVASTPWGKIGMFVCADGRLPEIPRLLALAGARLQLDLTAWVSSGRDPARLTNPQAEYMLRVRALENRSYMAAANKVGVEAGRVVYCGRSQVISPEGEVLALAGSTTPQVIYADIELPGSSEDPLWPDFDPLRDRRPADYGPLASPVQPSPPPGPAPVVRLAAVQLSRRDLLPQFLYGLACEDALAAVTSPLPADPGSLPGPARGSDFPPVMITAWWRHGELLARLETPGFTVTVERSLAPARRVYDTPAGRVGVMLDREGLLPEVPRLLALAGADWIAWPCSLPADLVELLARTRAAENRVFVVAANTPDPLRIRSPGAANRGTSPHDPPGTPGQGNSTDGGASLVVDPDGRILAQAFVGRDQSIAGQAHLCLARTKTIVPGTDAMADRRPETYTALTEITRSPRAG